MLFFLFSNIAHCYNKKKSYDDALEYGLKAIESKPGFFRVYLRMHESYTGLEDNVMAALVLMKGKENVTEFPNAEEEKHFKDRLRNITRAARTDANAYIEKSSYRSAKDIDLRRLNKEGLKPRSQNSCPPSPNSKDPVPPLMVSSSGKCPVPVLPVLVSGKYLLTNKSAS